MKAVVLIVIVLVISIVAQTPPCSEDQLKRAKAEWAASAGRVEVATDGLVRQKLAEELISAKQQLAAVQNNATLLCGYYKGVQGRLEVAQSSTDKNLIAALTAERDKLRAKISRANKRWFARHLHIGRIGER